MFHLLDLLLCSKFLCAWENSKPHRLAMQCAQLAIGLERLAQNKGTSQTLLGIRQYDVIFVFIHNFPHMMTIL